MKKLHTFNDDSFLPKRWLYVAGPGPGPGPEQMGGPESNEAADEAPEDLGEAIAKLRRDIADAEARLHDVDPDHAREILGDQSQVLDETAKSWTSLAEGFWNDITSYFSDNVELDEDEQSRLDQMDELSQMYSRLNQLLAQQESQTEQPDAQNVSVTDQVDVSVPLPNNLSPEEARELLSGVSRELIEALSKPDLFSRTPERVEMDRMMKLQYNWESIQTQEQHREVTENMKSSLNDSFEPVPPEWGSLMDGIATTADRLVAGGESYEQNQANVVIFDAMTMLMTVNLATAFNPDGEPGTKLPLPEAFTARLGELQSKLDGMQPDPNFSDPSPNIEDYLRETGQEDRIDEYRRRAAEGTVK